MPLWPVSSALPKSFSEGSSAACQALRLAIIGTVNAPRLERIVLPDRRSLALDGRTWAEVSLATLRENFKAVQRHVGPDVAVCAVVKADGYGHGATECALALEAEGAPWLGVTDAAEGRALRGAGIWTRILLMTGIWKGEEDGIVAHNLTPTVWEAWHIERLEKAAKKQQINLPVHLKIETGMNRLGATIRQLPQLCEKLAATSHLHLEGVSTHFASAEVLDADETPCQLQRFEEALAVLHQHGLYPPLAHTSNSAAVSARPDTWKTMVRPGILLYGYSLPARRAGEVVHDPSLPLIPVLTWKTRVLTVKDVAAGEAVGYMGTYTTKERSRIAVLPVGYADGYPRLLSNRARVVVRGEYAPVVGRVSMDLTMVDVGRIPGVAVGDEVILIGANNGKCVDAVELARLCDTVPYEILCGISQRVPRVYS